jgi:hypothetical protein
VGIESCDVIRQPAWQSTDVVSSCLFEVVVGYKKRYWNKLRLYFELRILGAQGGLVPGPLYKHKG